MSDRENNNNKSDIWISEDFEDGFRAGVEFQLVNPNNSLDGNCQLNNYKNYKKNRLPKGRLVVGSRDRDQEIVEMCDNFMAIQKTMNIRHDDQDDRKWRKERNPHILDGYIEFVNDFSNNIQIIKSAKTTKDAWEGLVAKGFSAEQSKAILDNRLSVMVDMYKNREELSDIYDKRGGV